jgi:hypothetical protein
LIVWPEVGDAGRAPAMTAGLATIPFHWRFGPPNRRYFIDMIAAYLTGLARMNVTLM